MNGSRALLATTFLFAALLFGRGGPVRAQEVGSEEELKGIVRTMIERMAEKYDIDDGYRVRLIVQDTLVFSGDSRFAPMSRDRSVRFLREVAAEMDMKTLPREAMPDQRCVEAGGCPPGSVTYLVSIDLPPRIRSRYSSEDIDREEWLLASVSAGVRRPGGDREFESRVLLFFLAPDRDGGWEIFKESYLGISGIG